jgi:exoribonuclease R
MGEIVNLRRIRKRRAAAIAEGEAAANRVLHGLSKNERRAAEAERDLAERRLEAHWVRKPENDGD